MEKYNQIDIYQEYLEYFKKMTDEELIGAFNHQVGNNGWIGRKITYLCALNAELDNRNFDYSAIGNKGGICLSKRIRLVNKKIVVI